MINFPGMGHEHFWTSGTDQAEEGKFFWMSTGKPVTYENWNAGEPNNFQWVKNFVSQDQELDVQNQPPFLKEPLILSD